MSAFNYNQLIHLRDPKEFWTEFISFNKTTSGLDPNKINDVAAPLIKQGSFTLKELAKDRSPPRERKVRRNSFTFGPTKINEIDAASLNQSDKPSEGSPKSPSSPRGIKVRRNSGSSLSQAMLHKQPKENFDKIIFTGSEFIATKSGENNRPDAAYNLTEDFKSYIEYFRCIIFNILTEFDGEVENELEAQFVYKSKFEEKATEIRLQQINNDTIFLKNNPDWAHLLSYRQNSDVHLLAKSVLPELFKTFHINFEVSEDGFNLSFTKETWEFLKELKSLPIQDNFPPLDLKPFSEDLVQKCALISLDNAESLNYLDLAQSSPILSEGDIFVKFLADPKIIKGDLKLQEITNLFKKCHAARLNDHLKAVILKLTEHIDDEVCKTLEDLSETFPDLPFSEEEKPYTDFFRQSAKCYRCAKMIFDQEN